MPPVLDVRDFEVVGARGFRAAIPALRLEPGGAAALYAASGAGKTTVLGAMFGIWSRADLHCRGRVLLAGRDLLASSAAERAACRRRDLVFLAQDAQAALDPLQPIGRQLVEVTGAGPAAQLAALRRLGLAGDLLARFPHQISGGQAQRVLLAIACLRAAPLVVADEPSASLDGPSYAELLALCGELLGGGSALLCATHELRLARDLGAELHVQQDRAFVRGTAAAPPWPARPPAGPAGSAVLAARGLRFSFGARPVLAGLDLELRRGEVTALIGASGAGKTTLLRVLAGQLRPDGGRVERPPRRAAVQLVAQDAFASLTPGRTLGGLLAEAHVPGFDAPLAAARLGLEPGALARTAAGLSGGERRRAALLRALAVAPDVLLLDEPTAALDRAAAVAAVGDALALQRATGAALLLATHDLGLAAAIGHRTLELREGVLCAA